LVLADGHYFAVGLRLERKRITVFVGDSLVKRTSLRSDYWKTLRFIAHSWAGGRRLDVEFTALPIKRQTPRGNACGLHAAYALLFFAGAGELLDNEEEANARNFVRATLAVYPKI
jgi:hypothetical protein